MRRHAVCELMGKRPLAAGLAAVLAAGVLAACGEDSGASAGEAGAGPAALTTAADPAGEALLTDGAPARVVAATGQPVPETFFLANGLQVVVIEDRRAPVVTHMVWYKVGAADEPPGHSGVAHFLEHLMFKGTERYPDDTFSQIVARNGGRSNAFTSYDYTAYFQRVAKDRLPLVMELEADRMTGLALTEEKAVTERDVILEERAQRTDDSPGALLSEQINALLYLAHPYGTPIIGWEHEIAQLTLEDALAFYRTWYTPSNAILIVAGDVDAEEVHRLAEKHYGTIPSAGPAPVRARPADPPQRAARRVIFEDERVEQPYVRRSYLAPGYATASPGEAEALDVLSVILGNDATSRMYRSLVVEQKIAVSASGRYYGGSLDEAAIGFFAIPAKGVAIQDAEAAIEAEIERLLADGVTEEEVARAKKTLLADSIFAQDDQQTLARIYGIALTTGLTVEQAATWPDRVLAVTVEDVNAAARRYLRPERSVTGILLRAEEAS